MKQKQLQSSISIDRFKEMDELAIQKYGLTIELMMENAGLQLARLISQYATKQSKIHIGIGKGNNGGGGLVAARRLAGKNLPGGSRRQARVLRTVRPGLRPNGFGPAIPL